MHVRKVGQKLLREIVSNMPHDVVQMHAYNVRNMSREMKYLYGLMLFKEPMSGYLWGMLSFEEADELCYAYRTILNEKTYNWLKEMDASDLSAEQEELRQATMNKIAEDKPINREMILSKLGFSKEKINECYLSFAEMLNHLLLKVDFDMYIDMARCFLPSYFPAMARFNKSKLLLLENHFNQKIEEQHQGFSFGDENIHPTDKLLYRLDAINNVIITLREQGSTNLRIEKINQTWKRLAETCFYMTAQKMGELPVNEFKRFVKPKINEVSKAFMGFFDNPLPENKIEGTMKKLIQDTYTCIDKSVTDKEKKNEMLNSFEAVIGVPYQKKKSSDKMIKSSSFGMKAEQLALEKLWIKSEFEALKKKYLTEVELQDKDSCRAVYAFMTDSELLYMMGVLTKAEYEACCKYQDKVVEYNGFQASESRSISEIFEILLDLPDEESVILPLKKEYLQKADQIRQASKLYQALYTDNYRPALTDILPENSEYNYLQKEYSPFIREGVFIENMVYTAHHAMQMSVYSSKLPELIDNYWLEAVKDIELLPHNPDHLYMKDTFQFCSLRFNEPSQEQDLIPDMPDCTAQGRKLLHEIAMSQLHFSLCELYANNYAERAHILNRYCHYIKPFQSLLKEPKVVDRHVQLNDKKRSEHER